MMLAERGIGTIVERIEHQAHVGDVLRSELVECGWTLLNDTALPVVNFTHESLEPTAAPHREVVDRVLAQRRAWISRVRLGDGAEALRASITNYNTGEHDVRALVDAVEEARLEVVGRGRA